MKITPADKFHFGREVPEYLSLTNFFPTIHEKHSCPPQLIHTDLILNDHQGAGIIHQGIPVMVHSHTSCQDVGQF